MTCQGGGVGVSTGGWCRKGGYKVEGRCVGGIAGLELVRDLAPPSLPRLGRSTTVPVDGSADSLEGEYQDKEF